MISVADNLFACKEGAWAERERTRIAAKLKKFKGPGEFNDTAIKMDPKWHCPQFLTFEYLALPSGKANCRQIFKLTAGSGPSAKSTTSASSKRGDHFVRFNPL